MWLHIRRKEWKTGSYTCTSLDVEGASDSTSPDITKAAKWHGLGDTLAMDWLHAGCQKNYSHTHRRNNGGVCGHLLSAQGHFITTQMWSLVVDELIEGLGNGCYTLGYALSSSAENSKILSHTFFSRLSMEKKWCGKTQLSFFSQNVQNLDEFLMKSVQSNEIW